MCGERSSLSLRERAGVRGNKIHFARNGHRFD
jgi:hypothetical protein